MAQLDHVAIEIRTVDPLARSIKEQIEELSFQSPTENKPFTIFRLPSHIRESNKNVYEPRMVSIGPYYIGRKCLKGMEEQKLRYVRKLLGQNPNVTLDVYTKMLKELEPKARSCYYERFNNMDSEQFVGMLLLDACFIIQLVVDWSFREDDVRDTVNDISWNVPLIKSDLLMLDNQIPFFVLQSVFDLYSSIDEIPSLSTASNFDFMSEDSEPEKASLFYLLVSFLQHGNEELPEPGPNNNFDHLLHFYYCCYMSTHHLPIEPKKFHPLKMLRPKKVSPLIKRLTMCRPLKDGPKHKHKRTPRMVPCATELQEAGITFKKANSKSIYNVSFSRGVLRIPYTTVEEATRPQIMHLIAFEQCSGQTNKPLTSYAVFMDCIVNTPKDVLILQQNGILENKLADEREVAEFFNQLRYCSYLDYDDHYLKELFKDVKKFCNSNWQKYRAKLYRDYFSNPWSIISFLAAIVLLLLSAVQTLYTVLSYFNSSH